MYINVHVSYLILAGMVAFAVGAVCLTHRILREQQSRSVMLGLILLRKPVGAGQNFYGLLKPLLWQNTPGYCLLFGGSALGDAIFQDEFDNLLTRCLAQKAGGAEALRLKRRLETMIRAATATKCGVLVDESLKKAKVPAEDFKWRT